MADQDSFPVGQAPWEKQGSAAPAADSFPVGSAPWETGLVPGAALARKMGYGESLVRGAIDTLPYLGAAGAAAVAAPETGGLGSIPAATLGYAGGKQLARILKTGIYGDDAGALDTTGIAKQTGGDLKEGAILDMGGKIIGAIPDLAKDGYDAARGFVANKVGPNIDYSPIANKDAVIAAGKSLGIEVPKGVLTDNPTYQKLESGLAQSGSFPAKSVRDQYNAMNQGLDEASSKIAEMKTPDSDFSLGQGLKSDLAGQVKAAKAPVTDMYDAIAPDLKNIPVNQSVVNRVLGNLKKNPVFQSAQGKTFIEDHADMISKQPDLASLKELRTTVGQSVPAAAADIDQIRASQMQRALTSIRDNSVEALKSDLPASAHSEIDNLQNQIALADAAHSSNIQDLNSIKSLLGNKDISSPGSFLAKLGEQKESDFAQKAANLDVQSMQNLKDKFPSVFEKAKTAKINDMISSATNPASGFSETRFFKQYSNLDSEAKQLLFTPEMQSHIENLQTLKQAIPEKLGPSGTPEGQMMMDMFSPKRNALDLGIKTALSSAGKASEISLPAPAVDAAASAEKIRPLLQLLKSGANVMVPTPQALPKAADKGDQVSKNTSPAPIKGPDKWANDGHANLLAHSADLEVKDQLSESKDALMSDPKSKQLLIQASDLKPGSKAMEKLLEKIKGRVAQGGQ